MSAFTELISRQKAGESYDYILATRTAQSSTKKADDYIKNLNKQSE